MRLPTRPPKGSTAAPRCSNCSRSERNRSLSLLETAPEQGKCPGLQHHVQRAEGVGSRWHGHRGPDRRLGRVSTFPSGWPANWETPGTIHGPCARSLVERRSRPRPGLVLTCVCGFSPNGTCSDAAASPPPPTEAISRTCLGLTVPVTGLSTKSCPRLPNLPASPKTQRGCSRTARSRLRPWGQQRGGRAA